LHTDEERKRASADALAEVLKMGRIVERHTNRSVNRSDYRRGWDLLFDFSVALAWIFFAAACFHQFVNDRKYLGVGLFLFNTLIACAFLLRRRACHKGCWWERGLAWGGTMIPIMGFHPARPGWALIGLTIQSVSLVGMMIALVSLGRSFGIAPADRGLVTTKVFRYLRHPLYASELCFCLGYLFANASLRNLAVFLVIVIVQIVRLLREEKILADYSSYSHRVRWRLIPLVW